MRILVDNRRVYLESCPLKLTKSLGQATSYLVKGHEFAPSFESGYWDGRKKLLTARRDGRISAPIGLAQEIVDLVGQDGEPYELVDVRSRPDPYLSMHQVWDRLRPYQREAVDAATLPRGSLRTVGRGIIKMPPRSGKTLTSASIIARLGVRTLFIVPATSLLYQSQLALSEALEVEVGIVGDGIAEIRDVTVVTIQTLCDWRGDKSKEKPRPQNPRYRELLSSADLVVFDECHHLEADKWRQVMQDSNAPYKIGLSATAFLDHEAECELGVIWLRACTGDVLVDISVSDLIEMGYLVQPEVRIYKITTPDLGNRKWSSALQKAGILMNKARNAKIVEVTKELVESGEKVIVISNRHEQLNELCRLFDLVGVLYRKVIGEHEQAEREAAVSALVSGQVGVLISTVMGEGVDIPSVSAIVNAEGGSSVKATYQRLRCLTTCEGKERAIVVDFADLTHAHFARHFSERLAVYRGERAFKVRVAG